MTVHFSVCVISFTHVVSTSVDHIRDTVTCRQFPNLTFAPRKTCHSGQQPHASTLSMSQQGSVYTTGYAFAILFLEKLYFFVYNPFPIFFTVFFTSALFFHYKKLFTCRHPFAIANKQLFFSIIILCSCQQRLQILSAFPRLVLWCKDSQLRYRLNLRRILPEGNRFRFRFQVLPWHRLRFSSKEYNPR